MLRLKLHSFLKDHSISQTALADAIADIVAESQSRTPVSERYLRYLANNTERLTPENKDRKPSLVMLGFIIRGLRRLTGEAVGITDVMEFLDDAYEAWSLPLSTTPQRGPIEIQTQRTKTSSGHELVPLSSTSESEGLLEQIKDLTLQRLRVKRLYDLERFFAAAVGGEAGEGTSQRRRSASRRRLLTLLAGLLITSLVVIAYDLLLVQPRILAARGGIFAFRDRVKATSELTVPTLIGPEGEVEQLAPVLRASDVADALGYEFYVENMVSGDSVYTGPLPGASFPIPEGTLCPNTPYTWRVRALGGDGWTSFSSALEFTVSPSALDPSQQSLLDLARIREHPDVPTLVSPLGSAASTAPVLAVEPASNVMGYGFYIRDLQNDSVIYNNNFALTNEVQVPDDLLEEGGIYQWNTRSRNCHYWSEFTPAQVFNVDPKGE